MDKEQWYLYSLLSTYHILEPWMLDIFLMHIFYVCVKQLHLCEATYAFTHKCYLVINRHAYNLHTNCTKAFAFNVPCITMLFATIISWNDNIEATLSVVKVIFNTVKRFVCEVRLFSMTTSRHWWCRKNETVSNTQLDHLCTAYVFSLKYCRNISL